MNSSPHRKQVDILATIPINLMFDSFFTEPTAPPTLTVKFVTSEAIHLCWTAPPDSQHNGVIIGYILEFLSNRSNESVSVPVNSTEYTLIALPHTRYEIKVAALNSAGEGPFSD